jgi:ubiquinone biosynthesis accessory factor UbiJ
VKTPVVADSASNPLLRKIVHVLNRALALDEKSRHRLALLGSCSVAFKLRGADAALIVDIRDGQLALATGSAGKPDVQIEGGIGDFVAMAKTQRDGTSLATGKVEIQGDLATAQQIQSLIAQASLDWEEMIAQLTGDILARQIGRVFRGGLGWARETGKVLERDIGEYLLYELRLLPTQREIEQFVRDGASTAAAVERLNTRITKVRRQRKSK